MPGTFWQSKGLCWIRKPSSIVDVMDAADGVVRLPWPQFYQTRSAWSMDQGSTKKRSAVHNFVPTVTKFCVMWEGLSLPQDTKFGNCRDEIVDRRVIFIWSLIHGSSWSSLIKVGPGARFWSTDHQSNGCRDANPGRMDAHTKPILLNYLRGTSVLEKLP